MTTQKTKVKYILQQSGEDVSYYPDQYLNSNYFPTKNVRIPVNKSTVLENGLVKPKDADEIVPFIDIKIKSSALYKKSFINARYSWKQ